MPVMGGSGFACELLTGPGWGHHLVVLGRHLLVTAVVVAGTATFTWEA